MNRFLSYVRQVQEAAGRGRIVFVVDLALWTWTPPRSPLSWSVSWRDVDDVDGSPPMASAEAIDGLGKVLAWLIRRRTS